MKNKLQTDIILSLGGCCAGARQLQRRGMRRCSYAIEWIGGGKESEMLPMLAWGIRNRFRNFCDKENLKPIEYLSYNGYLRPGYYDERYKMYNVHTFPAPGTRSDWYEQAISVVRRRIERMYNDLSRARSAYFVYTTYNDYDPRLAFELYDALKETFPELDLRLRAMMFNAKHGPFGVNRGNDRVMVFGYERGICDYDLRDTSSEWLFLDGIELTGRRGHSWLERSVFRIWRAVGRWLNSRGYDVTMKIK